MGLWGKNSQCMGLSLMSILFVSRPNKAAEVVFKTIRNLVGFICTYFYSYSQILGDNLGSEVKTYFR